MALARPLTKAAQAATTRQPEPGEQSSSSTSNSTTLGEALARWSDHLQTSERIRSQRTIDAYLYGVGFLVRAVGTDSPLSSVQPESIERLLADLKRSGKSAGGRALVFRPIRTFFRWAVDRDLLSSSPANRVAAPKAPAIPIQTIAEDEFGAILKTTEHRTRWAFRARRDRAVLLLLWTTGARLSEIAGLRCDDIDTTAGTFIVHGKGSKDRVLPLLPSTAHALDEYLRLERPRSAYSASPALWLAPRGALTSNGIAQLVAERGRMAGIERRLHPHMFRHSFVKRALALGMSDSLVMSLSGHTTPSMLQRYGADRRSEDAMAMWRRLAV